MTPIANEAVVTANGEYSLYEAPPGSEVVVEWEITAGSATVTPGYQSWSGAFRAHTLLDGSAPVFAATYGVIRLAVPASGRLALKVTNQSSLQMVISQTVCK